jgi:hypothetical protein
MTRSVRADEREVQRGQLLLDGWLRTPGGATPLAAGGDRLAPAAVSATPVKYDDHAVLARELALQMRSELGMLLRHNEEVARHWGILPQRERERV